MKSGSKLATSVAPSICGLNGASNFIVTRGVGVAVGKEQDTN